MKLRKAITINGRSFQPGDHVSFWAIYPFFLFHMLMFGGSGFFMAYMEGAERAPLPFIYAHGLFAILVYVIFYLAIFGADEVKWMFINAGLGFLGIYTQMGWILSLFGKDISTYPIYIHLTPFLYFVLYTFLLRQALIDILGVRDNPERLQRVNYIYLYGSAGFYLLSYFFF
jgi:hypothetical protein